jgi:hypothetical protein
MAALVHFPSFFNFLRRKLDREMGFGWWYYFGEIVVMLFFCIFLLVFRAGSGRGHCGPPVGDACAGHPRKLRQPETLARDTHGNCGNRRRLRGAPTEIAATGDACAGHPRKLRQPDTLARGIEKMAPKVPLVFFSLFKKLTIVFFCQTIVFFPANCIFLY